MSAETTSQQAETLAPPLGLRVAGGDLCGIAAKATTEPAGEKAVAAGD
jgi:hypothetical protein